MKGFFRRECSIPSEVQKLPSYFLVDYDFVSAKQKRIPCRRELLRVLGVRTLRERTCNTSVIPVVTFEEAMKLYEILTKYGARVNVRECKAITVSKNDEQSLEPDSNALF